MLSNSYDLGIFEQTIRSYAEGRLPVAELRGPDFPVLGEHFSPVLAVLAPVYMVWPSPDVLLIVQALLIAVSVVPLTRWAYRVLGSAAAAVVGVSYGLSWGIASAVGFDFHEVAFAVPLLACALTALANDRPRGAVLWALPLVLVKEDLGLTVAVIGVIVACRGQRRIGVSAAVLGVVATLTQMLVFMPAVASTGSYYHFSWLDGSEGGAADFVYRYTVGLITPQAKVSTLILVLAPTLFLALRSPLLWVMLPTLLWRFVSNLVTHWGTFGHYSLVLMPIVFAAFIDALSRRRSIDGSVRRYVMGSAAVSLLLLPHFPFWQMVQTETWRDDPRVAVARSLMKRIPDDAAVQASSQLVPQLTARTEVSLFGYHVSRPDPEWIMVDTWVPHHRRWPLDAVREKAALDYARAHGYETVIDREGFVLLRRSPA
ncbi:DUF2079 domain-containing protein [Streptomyces wuyuanensis]|uniref:DUF2079 domain-containing protein n=1 Tax=Streptomyces wuyuanensis TaxID=1196353 RepID=UPI00342CA55C